MIIKILKFILLGFIQGFTEPIPVSSSGHLLIFQKILETESLKINYDSLAILTNFGSFIAILFIFRKDIKKLVINFFKYLNTKKQEYYSDFKYCLLIVIGTIPAGIGGLIVTKFGVFDIFENNIKIIGITLLITAVFLYLVRNIKGSKKDSELTFRDALFVGFFQMIALIPGISRSGSTLVAGMKKNMNRETAFKYSFMLYFPISIATMIFEIKNIVETNMTFETLAFYILASIIAMVVTFFSLNWFKNIVKKGKLIYFVIYCLIVGSLVLIFL